ncbi:PEGA domain-containing protein [Sorangium atrum]|uniref:PEGA domain-containing protein n=1 Tax=Sorangium atrum TaxID=2995308 RepID=A0ABT5C460_9BACT|nr:PEGA domain-containing protein [Sorangium aterium]MDC0680718.1 PEGA domain-containing protein [Sorangium aterium]
MASRNSAEAELESAWELNPTFDVAYNLGNTKYQLKKYREAAEHLSFALRNWPLVKTVAKLKPTAEQRLAESRAQVGALRVTVSAAGAEVLVDGKAVGRAPLDGEVFVEPGEHRVEARLEGYAPLSHTVKSAKGETAEVGLALVPVKSEARAAGVKTEGGMGAAGVGAGAPVMGQPPAGPVEPPPKKNWVPVIALGAASAVGLGVGIGMTVARNSAHDDARSKGEVILRAGGECATPSATFVKPCQELQSIGSRGATLGDAARVAYIASGALAIAAVTYVLWSRPKATTTERVRALPRVQTGSVGIDVLGAW